VVCDQENFTDWEQYQAVEKLKSFRITWALKITWAVDGMFCHAEIGAAFFPAKCRGHSLFP